MDYCCNIWVRSQCRRHKVLVLNWPMFEKVEYVWMAHHRSILVFQCIGLMAFFVTLIPRGHTSNSPNFTWITYNLFTIIGMITIITKSSACHRHFCLQSYITCAEILSLQQAVTAHVMLGKIMIVIDFTLLSWMTCIWSFRYLGVANTSDSRSSKYQQTHQLWSISISFGTNICM